MKKLILSILFLFLTCPKLISQTNYDTYYEASESLLQDALTRFNTPVTKDNIIFSIRIKEDIYPKSLRTSNDTLIEAYDMESEAFIIYSTQEVWVFSGLYPTDEIYYKLYREYCQKHEKYWHSSGVTWDCGGISRYSIRYYQKPNQEWYEIFIHEWEEDSTLYFILDKDLNLIRRGKY